MRKIIAFATLFLAVLFGASTVEAQWSTRDYNQDRYERQERWGNRASRIVHRNEYRYVRIGRQVWREMYRSTYLVRERRNGRYQERLLSRRLVNRTPVGDWNRLNRDRFRIGVYFNL